MKIAFVWKWGSWKTTLTTLFIKFLIENQKKVIAADADINVWLADALWINFQKEKYISKPEISEKIRKYLIWENKKIISPNHFVKTTPPAFGSKIIDFSSKDFFLNFGSYQDKNLKFFHIWTYEKDDIWTSCYHTSLSVFENVLSHSFPKKNEYFIADMVAWNDSFSNTLHSQFDAIFLVIEPTKEWVEMGKHFLNLSKEKTASPVYILANKIEDEEDLEFLKNHNIDIFFSFLYNKNYKKQRRNWWLKIDNNLSKELNNFFEKVQKNIKKDSQKRLENLWILHKKYINLDYIKNPLWDLSNQIDTNFKY